MKRVVTTAIVLIFSVASLFAADFDNTTDSGNWKNLQPAFLSLDNYSNTYAAVDEGETSAWIELEYPESQRVYGYKIDATIPQGCTFYASYDENGARIIIPASFVESVDGEKTLLFQNDEIVTKNLSFHLYGESTEYARIYDIEPLVALASGKLIEADFSVVETDEQTPYYTDLPFLFDGYTGTAWWTRGNYTGSYDFSWFNSDEHGNAFKFEREQLIFNERNPHLNSIHDSISFSREAELNVIEGGEYETLLIYVEENAFGELVVSSGDSGTYTEIYSLNLEDVSGWQYIDLAEDNNIDSLKLELSGRCTWLGGIGEIKLQKLDDAPAPGWMQIAGIKEAGIESTSFFDAIKDDADYELVFSLNNHESEDIPLMVNNKTVYDYEKKLCGNITTFRVPLDPNFIWEGNNFLKFSPGKNSKLLGAAIRETEESGQIFINESLEGYDKIININESFDLKQLEVVTDSDSDYSIRIYGFNGEEEIYPYYEDLVIKKYNLPAYTDVEQITVFGADAEYSFELTGVCSDSAKLVKITPERAYDSSLDKLFIHGTTDADEHDVIRINGRVAYRLGNYFWIPLTMIDIRDAGIYDIEAVIERNDTKINEYKCTYMHELDTNFLTLDNEEEINYTTEVFYNVTGTYRGFWGTELYIDEEKVSAWRGEFSHNTEIKEGLNLVKVELRSRYFDFSYAVKYLKVYKYTDNLIIIVDKPADGSYVFKTPTAVSGKIENSIELQSVRVNGLAATLTGNNFVASIPVADGSQEVTVEVVDGIIGTRSKTINIKSDFSSPVISQITPEDGFWTAQNHVRVEGHVSDENYSQVYVNGVLATQIDGWFNCDAELEEGANVIEITARDHAGNISRYGNFIVNCDTNGPETVNLEANITGWSNNNRPTLTFSATDDGVGMSYYAIDIAGNGFINQESPFQTPVIEDGTNDITVRAYDLLGNYSDKTIEVKIDTLPPDTPQTFRAIPGNENVVLSWSEDDDETVEYEVSYQSVEGEFTADIDIEEGVEDEETSTLFFNINYSETDAFIGHELENGETYTFSIVAIDRAGNRSFQKDIEVITGVAVEEYVADEGSFVEYEAVKLVIPAESLPNDVAEIIIYETYEEGDEKPLTNSATYPLISPIYSFEVEKTNGTTEDHVEFEEEFLCKFDFDESMVPEGFPEQNLGVYYFDTNWNKWFKVEGSVVDTENNQILFKTNHFTDFSVQPTVIEDLSAQELAAIEFDPFSTTTAHQPMTVSPQGGGVSTSMTEFVLPGKNGLDLEIRRTYDTGTAKGDAGGISANFSMSLADIMSGKIGADLGNQLLMNVANNIQNSVLKYFQNNGDFAYSLGQGWRLNLPYIRSSNSGILVRTSSGSFFDIKAMTPIQGMGHDIVYERELWLENHEREDFTLRVTQAKVETFLKTTFSGSFDYKSLNSWTMINATLIEKNGREYNFDAFGRLVSINDPNGNTITLTYSEGDPMLLDYITDTMGRKVRVEYNSPFDVFCVPQIERIWIEDDPAEREVSYSYSGGGFSGFSIPLPILTSSNDVNSRDYNYDYKEQFLFSGEAGVKINAIAAIADLCTGGAFSMIAETFGLTSVKVHASAQSFWTFNMIEQSGYGITNDKATYGVESLFYAEADPADFLLGFLPTALDMSVGMQQRSRADQLVRFNETSGKSLTENYKYIFKYAGEKQFYVSESTKNDGRIREEYNFETVEKLRWTMSSWSDFLANVIAGSGVTGKPYYFDYQPWEKEKRVFNASTGALIETIETTWNEDFMRPASKKNIRSNDYYVSNTFSYDNWGNIEKNIIHEQNGSTFVKTEIRTAFAGADSTLAGVTGVQSSPYSSASINSDYHVHDRPERILTKYSNTGASTRYINQAFSYDTKGNRTGSAIHNSNNGWQQTAFEVNGAGEVTKITSPLGQVTDIDYDYDGYNDYYVISQTKQDVNLGDDAADGTDITTKTIYYRYSGLPAYNIDSRGYVTKTEYDAVGRKTAIILPDDNDNTTWDPLEEADSDYESNNPKTVISYNDNAKTITVTNPVGAVSVYKYHDTGKITEKAQTNRYGATESGLNDVTFSNPEIITNYFGYDAYNNITSHTDGRGSTTNYSYNPLGQLTKVTYPNVDGTRSVKSYIYDYATRSKRIIDENGNVTIEYNDSKGNVLKRIDDAEGYASRTTEYFYDGAGNLVEEIDGNDNSTTFTYNERNQQTLKTLPSVKMHDGVLQFSASPSVVTAYNIDGYKITETTRRNNADSIVEFENNGLGQIIKTTAHYSDFEGTAQTSVTKNLYDKAGNVIEVTDPRGNVSSITYSARARVSTQTDALNNTISFKYDDADRQTSMTDQRGNSGNYTNSDFKIEYVYDDLDRLIKGILPKHQDLTAKPEIKLVYDKNGNNTKRIEADGGVVTSTFDARNRNISVKRADVVAGVSYTTTNKYDGVGNLVKVTEPGGNTTSYAYDGINRLTNEYFIDGGETVTFYDDNDNVTIFEGPNGYRTYYEYNALNLMTYMKDQLGGISEYLYNETGNNTWRKDENDVVWKTEFDELDRPVIETNGRGKVTTFKYDEAGNLTETVDPRGTVITNTYGVTNLLDSSEYVNDAESNILSYVYDEAGLVKSQNSDGITNAYNTIDGVYTADPYGLIFSDIQNGSGVQKATTYNYDGKNRMTGITMPSGEEVSYGYNAVDELKTMPGYVVNEITYDNNTYLSSYELVNGLTLNRAYDTKKRVTEYLYETPLTTVEDPLKRITLDYDRENNIIKKNGDYFSYDGKNRLLSGSLAGPEASVPYDYEGEALAMNVQPDIIGEEAMVLDESDFSLDWGAKSLGIDLGYGYRVGFITLTIKDTVANRLDPDKLEIYTAISNRKYDYGEPEEYSYSTDEFGNITIELKREGGVFARYIKIHCHFNDMNEDGTYQNTAQIRLDETEPFAIKIMSAGRNEFYNYDKKNNRKRVSYFTTEFSYFPYTYYPNSDLIMTTVDSKSETDAEIAYKYDDNGNMTEKGDSFTIDGDEVTINEDGTYFRYEYDLLNRLTEVYKYDSGTLSVEKIKSYRYNANNLLVEAEDHINNELTYYSFDIGGKMIEKTTDTVIRDYIYLGTRVLAHKEGADTSFYATDHIGSTIALTDDTGESIWTGSVTPFADSETVSNEAEHVLYTGKELDEATGLYYFNARWYDPNLGRFTTEDPIRDGLNWYIYANNNPLRFVDPTGLIIESVWDAASLGIGVVSIRNNIKNRDYRKAAVDGVGIIADSLALLVPVIPGGAGVAIKAVRVANIADNVVQGVDSTISTVDAIKKGDTVDAVINAANVAGIGLSRVANKTADAARDADKAARNAGTTSQTVMWATEEQKLNVITNSIKAGNESVDAAQVFSGSNSQASNSSQSDGVSQTGTSSNEVKTDGHGTVSGL